MERMAPDLQARASYPNAGSCRQVSIVNEETDDNRFGKKYYESTSSSTGVIDSSSPATIPIRTP